jgi:hypothetical protein
MTTAVAPRALATITPGWGEVVQSGALGANFGPAEFTVNLPARSALVLSLTGPAGNSYSITGLGEGQYQPAGVATALGADQNYVFVTPVRVSGMVRIESTSSFNVLAQVYSNVSALGNATQSAAAVTNPAVLTIVSTGPGQMQVVGIKFNLMGSNQNFQYGNPPRLVDMRSSSNSGLFDMLRETAGSYGLSIPWSASPVTGQHTRFGFFLVPAEEQEPFEPGERGPWPILTKPWWFTGLRRSA